MAPTSTPFKGAIRYQKKQEMISIANSLGLKVDPATNTRDALEDVITKELRTRRNELETHPLYEKLYDSLDRDAKKENESESDGSPEATSKSPRKIAGRKSAAMLNGTPSASHVASQAASQAAATASAASSAVKEAASDASTTIKKTANQQTVAARSSFENLKSRVLGTTQQATAEVEQAANDAQRQGNALLKKARTIYRKYERRAKKEVTKARLYASDTKHITAALLILEAIILLNAVMPTHTIEIGQSRFQTLKNTIQGNTLLARIPRWAITVPHPKLLLSLAFWQPLAVWLLWTVVVPVLASNLITFDRGHAASLFTFNFTRLAILLYLVFVIPRGALSGTIGTLGVAAGEPGRGRASVGILSGRSLLSYDYALDHLSAPFSLVLAGVATGFTVHEAIVHRGR